MQKMAYLPCLDPQTVCGTSEKRIIKYNPSNYTNRVVLTKAPNAD